MRLRLVSAALALLGAVILVVVGVLAMATSEAGWHQPAAIIGYALLLLALAVVGYGLVDKAPLWLGVIVGICVPLLAATLWQAIAPALEDLTSRGEGLVWLVAGLVGLVIAEAQRRQDFAIEARRDRIGP